MSLRWVAVCLGLAILPACARADPIVYQEQAIASGSLGGLDFTGALVIISVVADTAGVVGTPFGLFTNTGQASVSIGALGQASFLDPLEAFAYMGPDGTELGITDPNVAADVLDTGLPPGFSFELATSLAPVTGASAINSSFPFATSAGDLELVVAGDSRFSATLQDVPEPASMLLLCGGLAAVTALQTRRRGLTAP